MDSPNVPHLRRGHISLKAESPTPVLFHLSALGVLICWVDGWLVVRYVGSVNYSNIFFEYLEYGGRKLLRNLGDSLS